MMRQSIIIFQVTWQKECSNWLLQMQDLQMLSRISARVSRKITIRMTRVLLAVAAVVVTVMVSKP
uniref:Uncharacterized protein n=1 Tax=uncultured marine virus TaxID=186617 RepID=A0A0F7L9D2_9VIRU|nr:hypothetical protein [uncultured marine virus]